MGKFFQRDKSLKGLWGSLAARVITVAMVFLVGPLIIYSVIDFTFDYQEGLHDLFLSIKTLGAGRARILSQFNHLEYRFLDMTDDLLELKRKQPGVTDEELNHFLAGIKQQQNVSAIFYLTLKDGKWICNLSSDPHMIGKEYSGVVNQRSLSQEHAATIRPNPQTGERYYLVSKRIYSPGSAEITGMLNIVLSNQLMLERLNVIARGKDPSEVSLLDPSGIVFLSSDRQLILDKIDLPDLDEPPGSVKPHRTIKMEPYVVDHDFKQNNYTFQIDGHKQYGVVEPIESSDLRVLVSVPRSILFQHFKHYMITFGGFFAFILVVGGVGTWWLTHRMANPFRALCQTMIKVEEGDYEARYIPQIMGYEINIVGDIFNEMIASLLSHMHAAENERVARELLAKELKIGHDVQKSILPRQLPSVTDLDIASGFLSAKEVAGDFYDLLVTQKQGDSHLMCAVADTAGKGITACFYSLGLRSILRSYASIYEDLATTLIQTNNAFCHDTGDTGLFVTAWVAYIDEKTKMMEYSSCGHPPALLKRKDGTIESLTTAGIALGAMHVESVETKKVQLESGDILVMYTDGVTEAHSSSKTMYGEDRLREFLDTHPAESSQKVIDDLLIDVGRFTTGTAQFDDLTVLVLRVV